jgi:hypothetical protein
MPSSPDSSPSPDSSTTSLVSIIPERGLRENFPNLLVKYIRELLASGADLKLEAANGTQIPYNAWMGRNKL